MGVVLCSHEYLNMILYIGYDVCEIKGMQYGKRKGHVPETSEMISRKHTFRQLVLMTT